MEKRNYEFVVECFQLQTRSFLVVEKNEDGVSRIFSQIFQVVWLEKCALIILELNWFERRVWR